MFIDNVEYPLGFNNVLNFLHMGSSIKQQLPTIHFSISDMDSVFVKSGIPDGIPLKVVIKSGQSRTDVYTFRKFHSTKELNGGIYTYQVDGYWDAALYWAGTECVGTRGSSDEVLSQIASLCGLKYSGTPTNDSQLWLQQNYTYGQFAKMIRQHGYVDATSCMALGVDLTGTMVYRNLNGTNGGSSPVKVVAFQRADDALSAIDYGVLQNSGFNNQLSGYASGVVSQTVTGDTASDLQDQLVFTADVRAPLYNTTVKGIAKRGNYSYSGVDVGNTHLTYDLAAYQNLRYGNLFSLTLQILFDAPTYLQLMNDITFSVTNIDNSQSTAYSGNYIVTGRAIYIQGVTYSEKLEVTRHGTNDAYVTG